MNTHLKKITPLLPMKKKSFITFPFMKNEERGKKETHLELNFDLEAMRGRKWNENNCLHSLV